MIGRTPARIVTALRQMAAECRQPASAAVLLVTLILVTRHALGQTAGARLLGPVWRALGKLWSPLGTPLFQNQFIAFTLQFLLPVVAIWLLHRQRLRDYGLGRGDLRFWLPLTAVIFAIQLLVISFYLGHDATYVQRYPSLAAARGGGAVFWAWESSRLFYMLSWEFLFRGYLLFALRPRLGLGAVPLQTVPFVLMHIVSKKPVSEVYFTIASGMLSGVFTLEARSIWPVVWLHAAGAVALDIVIVYFHT